MRVAFLLVVAAAVAACDAGEKPKAAKRETAATRVPPGPYVVHFDCFHSDQPWGKGSQYRNLSVDLAARTQTLDAWEITGEVLPPDQEPPRKPPTVTPLSEDRVARIETAVVAVLRGGPYKEELPVSEGTPCELWIEAAGAKIFSLEKASQNEKDAATDLVNALR